LPSRFHSTPDPEDMPDPVPTHDPNPPLVPDVPPPAHAPVEEPNLPEPPIRVH
jgi:hypothetical protein